MIYKEEGSDDRESGNLNIILQLSLSDQESKTITIRENGAGFEVITRDASGLLEKKALQHCG
ncbi:MAG: hypothetical protein H8D23_28190 [Candidatus Brocadiales bacterium]|nr:hypothetical protein [Candidatus Brocadiales bacterium]